MKWCHRCIAIDVAKAQLTRTWLSRSQLSAAEGTAVGGHQILSLTLFEKTPILCALQTIETDANFAENANQLILFEL
jgi:hypothetical protein